MNFPTLFACKLWRSIWIRRWKVLWSTFCSRKFSQLFYMAEGAKILEYTIYNKHVVDWFFPTQSLKESTLWVCCKYLMSPSACFTYSHQRVRLNSSFAKWQTRKLRNRAVLIPKILKTWYNTEQNSKFPKFLYWKMCKNVQFIPNRICITLLMPSYRLSETIFESI